MKTRAFKSEIRESVIRELLEKVRKENYSEYLASLRLEKIRLFKGAQIDFDFPVTALVGPNGGGKSTILGACACAYSSIDPYNIFRKSRIGDDNMDDWELDYRIVDRKVNPKGSIILKVALKDNTWKRSQKFSRQVTFLGINRTVPAIENPLFTHKRQLSAYEKPKGNTTFSTKQVENINHIKKEAERILGKSLINFELLEVTFVRQVLKRGQRRLVDKQILDNGDTIITTRISGDDDGNDEKLITKQSKKYIFIGDNEGAKYSEFHFGAGEASVIHMVTDIESQPNDSLVLIEEIENGSHPLAVQRMVEYLIDVAKRKNIQTVFTTHSNYALEPLPSEAIWASIDGKLQQGKLTVESLRAISGRVDKRLAIFVEDNFAQSWLEHVIRDHLENNLDEIGIYPVYGDGSAVKTHLGHMANPAIPFHSVCFIDGDSQQTENEEKRIYRLPGTVPETTVFNDVLENLQNNIAILTVACQRPLDKQNTVAEIIKNVSNTNRDPHLLFSQVGLKLGFTPAEVVIGAFIATWIQEHADEVSRIVTQIKKALELSPKH